MNFALVLSKMFGSVNPFADNDKGSTSTGLHGKKKKKK